MIKFTTSSGSTYEVDEANTRMRRVEASHALRRDNDWQTYSVFMGARVDSRAFFILEPLGDGNMTTRMTTLITSVENSLL